MRAPLSWLRDFAPFGEDAGALAASLSELGLVVEGVERVGEGLDDVVVARVVSTRAHPNADQVQLVDVDPGDGKAIQIVCGAFNFGPGDLVPLVPAGSRLPGDREIGRRKVRGEWSEGMLCSGLELGLSDDHEGIMVLPDGLPPGAGLSEALGISPDVVFDLDVTPNRPDALSMGGIARDLAAQLRLPFALPESATTTTSGLDALVAVEAPDLCPRFTATLIDGVAVGPSPAWISNRLALAGMRPINNVVDVSNYVMLELGHPNHPYDVEQLAGEGLLVRRASHGEIIQTLDRVERRLQGDDCLICDATGAAVGIGGIMGGASTEISPSTHRVLLEVAYFSPMAIARTSKRLGLRTEASVRFERGVDPHGVPRAVARFCQLAGEVAGAAAVGTTADVGGAAVPDATAVTVRTDRVNAILGTSLSPDEVRALLEPIGFQCLQDATAAAGELQVSIPTWRPDSEREIDVIEEVARHHGYSNIDRTVPAVTTRGGLTPYQRSRRRVREVLVGAGLSEAWATSFLAPGDLERAKLPAAAVEVENPLAAEESILRPSLRPGLLKALVTNQGHRHPDVALFEIGHVFLPPADGSPLPAEPEHLAVAIGSAEAPAAKRVLDVLSAGLRLDRPALEAAEVAGLHPTRSAFVVLGGEPVGAVGEVDPEALAAYGLESSVAWLELDLTTVLARPRPLPQYRPVSRFPSADIDLAFAVDDVTPASDVEEALRAAAGDLLVEVRLFDVFRGPQMGEGRRSLAYRLRFAALDHTLSDEELTLLRQRCIDAVVTALPAALRA